MCMALGYKQDLLKREKQYLYEQYKLNRMERRTYLNRMEILRKEESRLSEQLQKMQEEGERCEEEGGADQEGAEYGGKFKSLTKDVVEQWIDCIYVYGESRIDIVYKKNKEI